MKIRFIYTDLPFWRAEVGRIALHIGNIEFEDVRIDREEFSRVREFGCLDDGTLIPFRQLPCLNIDGKSICQTGGIARLCGKLGGLYPKEDAIKAASIDQVIDMATDLNVLLGPSGIEKNKDKKKAMREELVQGPLKRKTGFLEELLIESQHDWFVGSTMTVADISIWRLMGWLSSGMIDHIPTTFLSSFPRLKKLCKKVSQEEKVREWIVMTYPKNYTLGYFD